MKNKFKVGDKVLPIKDLSGFGFPEGEVATVVDVYAHGTVRIRDEKFREATFYASTLQLADSKPTKEQRITKLEEEVAELKLIVAQIRKPSTAVEEALANDIIEFEGKQYKKVDREAREGDVVVAKEPAENTAFVKLNTPYLVMIDSLGRLCLIDYDVAFVYEKYFNRTPENVDVYELMDGYNPGIVMVDETPIKTANQLRAEIIEKAKGFIVECEGVFGDYEFENKKGRTVCCEVEFILNKEKRKVVALLKGVNTKRVHASGTAICSEGDVFNEYIGKAIALGRALGLDVSEFEQAVQPMLAVGQVVTIVDYTEDRFEITGEQEGDAWDLNNLNEIEEGWERSSNLIIINDTNAQYEEVK